MDPPNYPRRSVAFDVILCIKKGRAGKWQQEKVEEKREERREKDAQGKQMEGHERVAGKKLRDNRGEKRGEGNKEKEEKDDQEKLMEGAQKSSGKNSGKAERKRGEGNEEKRGKGCPGETNGGARKSSRKKLRDNRGEKRVEENIEKMKRYSGKQVNGEKSVKKVLRDRKWKGKM